MGNSQIHINIVILIFSYAHEVVNCYLTCTPLTISALFEYILTLVARTCPC